MLTPNTTISKLYEPDAKKAHQLLKTLAKGTQLAVRTVLKINMTLKINTTLMTQLLFVTNGTVAVLTYPMLTTDEQNKGLLIGT
jgi:hypothetical protein